MSSELMNQSHRDKENLLPVSVSLEQAEQLKSQEGVKELSNLFSAVQVVHNEEKLKSPDFIKEVNYFCKRIMDESYNDFLLKKIQALGIRFFQIGENTSCKGEIDESTYALFSVAWEKYQQILRDKFHIVVIGKESRVFDPSVHTPINSLGETNQIVARVIEPGFQLSTSERSVPDKARVIRGDVIEDDRQVDAKLAKKYDTLLAQKINEVNSATEKKMLDSSVTKAPKEMQKQSDVAGLENKEAPENPERQKALVVLSEFFKERSQQTDTHRQLDTLIKKMRDICISGIPYAKVIHPDLTDIKVRDDLPWSDDHYVSIVISGKDKNGVTYALSHGTYFENFKNLQPKETYKNDPNLQTFIGGYEQTRDALEETRKKILQARETVVRSFADFEEFKEINSGTLAHVNYFDLYNRDGFIRISSEDQTGKKNYIDFRQEETLNYDFLGRRNRLDSLMKRLNISRDDIEQMKEIQWTDKDKKALKLVLKYHEEAKTTTIEPYILNMQENPALSLSDMDSGNIRYMLTRSNIRKLYDTVGLPSQFRENACLSIMTGSLTLDTL